MNPVYRKMHKNVLHPKEIDLILRILPNECAFVVETHFLHHTTFLMFFSQDFWHHFWSYSGIHWDSRALISQPNAWHTSDFNSSAAQQDRPNQHAHTLTQFRDATGQSCGFHCQFHNARWRESNRGCKRERVCDSDWSIYWVIALGFVSFHISGWVYLALISSTITEDD